MRVTNSSTYRNYTTSLNSVHLKLNKSMTKISSGAAYETAADAPLAYYTGKKIDNQYLDTLAKNTLITDIKNRLYQQELGVRDIQSTLSQAKKQVIYAKTATTTGDKDIQTLQEDLVQKARTMVNDLNTQYQDFYVYGGNDVSVTPFALDINDESMTLTFNHTFPGDDAATEFKFKYEYDDTAGDFQFKLESVKDSQGTLTAPPDAAAQNKLVQAMSEQGKVDIGYGSINDRDTLLDTYTGGMNVLSGLNSDAVRAINAADQNTPKTEAFDAIMKGLNESPVALTGKAALSIGEYIRTKDKDLLDDRLADTIDRMTVTEHTVSTFYSDLGNKSQQLDQTAKRLDTIEDSLTEQYKDTLGADPYASIMEMFNNLYSYNAALQVGSKLMNTSLFDFVR